MLEEGGYYRLLGRTSVDVIKQGGYKASRSGWGVFCCVPSRQPQLAAACAWRVCMRKVQLPGRRPLPPNLFPQISAP